MAHPYKSTKGFYPNTEYNGSVGRERKVTDTYAQPGDQTVPQAPEDKHGADYYDDQPIGQWPRLSDATKKQSFDRNRK